MARSLRALNHFLTFMRIKIGLLAAFLSASGYLLFNSLDTGLIPMSLSVFFLFTGIYSYNNLVDRQEDEINRNGANPIASSIAGRLITASCFFISALAALSIPLRSLFFFIVLVAIGFIYSFLRIKRFFLIKNVYTAFGMCLAFLMGTADAPFSLGMMLYYFLLSLLIFIGSVVSDIRDCEGDKRTSHRTLPAVYGQERTKIFVYSLLLLFLSVTFASGLPHSYVFVPFVTTLFFFLHFDRFSLAHSVGGTSFIFFFVAVLMG